MHTQVRRKLSVLRQPEGASAIAPWAVVLGGEGVRLRPLGRQLCGDERPKQFAKIVGSKSLLRHTLDRVGLKIPPSRTVISRRRQRNHTNHVDAAIYRRGRAWNRDFIILRCAQRARHYFRGRSGAATESPANVSLRHLSERVGSRLDRSARPLKS
jgi:hypothetical protein